jgi:hypothetical protein
MEFDDLPTEIRQNIWELTLEPRVIDLAYDEKKGFYAFTNTPVALRVNKDSREAVIKRYPRCFGSILHSARIRFNFSLDTLFFYRDLQALVGQFLVGMTRRERRQIQFIAVDECISTPPPEELENPEYDMVSHDVMKYFRKAVRVMPALKEFNVVFDIQTLWQNLPVARGFLRPPTILSKEIPTEIKDYFSMLRENEEIESNYDEANEIPLHQCIIGEDLPCETYPVLGWTEPNGRILDWPDSDD